MFADIDVWKNIIKYLQNISENVLIKYLYLVCGVLK